MSTLQAEIAEEAHGWRLDRALADALPDLSRERIKALISSGNVFDDTGNPIRDPRSKAVAGASFAISLPDPVAATAEPQDIPLKIVFEDDYLIVIDKPAGLVVHPAAGNADGTLVNALLHHCRGNLSGIGGIARPGIVHRIDKGTSGLIVAAKTDKAHEGLSRQFAAHSIERAYLAIVAGMPRPSAGTVRANLARSSQNRQKIAVVEPPHGKHAVTHYRMVTPLREAALVECRLETGRTHQVRVHMTHIGHPLLGDPAYGRTRAQQRPVLAELGFARQALHAARLGFVHPVNSNALTFSSEMPLDMQELFRAISV